MWATEEDVGGSGAGPIVMLYRGPMRVTGIRGPTAALADLTPSVPAAHLPPVHAPCRLDFSRVDGPCRARCPIRTRHTALELTILMPCLDEARASGTENESVTIVTSAQRVSKFTDVPTTLRKDGRQRTPQLRTSRDGWRHLRARLALTVNRPFRRGLNRLRVFVQEPA